MCVCCVLPLSWGGGGSVGGAPGSTRGFWDGFRVTHGPRSQCSKEEEGSKTARALFALTKAECLKQLQKASNHKGFWTINAHLHYGQAALMLL